MVVAHVAKEDRSSAFQVYTDLLDNKVCVCCMR